jgi:hypothetical protein
MKFLAAFALVLAVTGCASPQRFLPPPAIGAPTTATETSRPSTGGPYTREREDEEFGGQQPGELAR